MTIKAFGVQVLLGDIPLNATGNLTDADNYQSNFPLLGLGTERISTLSRRILALAGSDATAKGILTACFVECLERRIDKALQDLRLQDRSYLQIFNDIALETMKDQFGCSSDANLLLKLEAMGGNDKQAPNLPEKKISDRLAKELNGTREVLTACGRIDVLTQDEIIEVKKGSGWKSAIGQVCAYGSLYPMHTKRIHLFDFNKEMTSQVKAICDPLDIVLTLELG